MVGVQPAGIIVFVESAEPFVDEPHTKYSVVCRVTIQAG